MLYRVMQRIDLNAYLMLNVFGFWDRVALRQEMHYPIPCNLFPKGWGAKIHCSGR